MPAPNPPTLVALHGHDDDESKTRAWAAKLAVSGWSLSTPSAPGRSWFESTPSGVEEGSLARSIEQVSHEVAVAAEVGGPVVLAGFSQGAAMALACGGVPGVDAVVAFCPFLPESEHIDLSAGPPALLLPADHDEAVPAFLGEDAAVAMAAAGRPVEVHTVTGTHRVGDEALARARSWLGKRMPRRMRFSVGLPVDRVASGEELVSGEAITELAAAWERLGFDAAYVTDHPAPDVRWLAAGGHHALEPTVALSAAAAATDRLRLHTHVMVLAYRNPFLAAKAVASLDVVSGGRVILGVAAGYLRPEFAALGVDFERRGALLDESIATVRAVWSGETVSAEGAAGVGWSARSVSARPLPPQRPGPPVWVGGNSVRAMRRAVECGDGWSPFPTPGGLDRAARTASITCVEDLTGRIERLDELCADHARSTRPVICFSPFTMGDYLADPGGSLGAMVEEVEQLGQIGVDWLCLTVPGSTRSEVLERAAELGQSLGLAPA